MQNLRTSNESVKAEKYRYIATSSFDINFTVNAAGLFNSFASCYFCGNESSTYGM